MDTTNCPPGWATDRVFSFEPPPACGMSVAAYVTWFAVLLVVRAAAAARVWRSWTARHVVGEAGAARRARERLPVIPFLEAVMLVTLTAMFALSVSSVITVQNGGVCAVFAIALTWFGFSSGLLARSYTKLAVRLVPLAMRTLGNSSSLSANNDHSQGPSASPALSENPVVLRLHSLDGVLRVLWGALVTGHLACLVLGVPVNLAIPSRTATWMQSIFGVFTMLAAALMTTVVYQLGRCASAATRAFADTQRELNVAAGGVDNAGVKRALRKIRVAQLTWGAFGLGSCLFFALVTAGVIPTSWIVMLIVVTMEVCMASIAASLHRVRRKRTAAPALAPTLAPGDPVAAGKESLKEGLTHSNVAATQSVPRSVAA